jgi:hypothetical protein
VHGINASEAMVAKLREKPGGDRIPVTMGDFADVGADSRYSLVYLLFNTLFALDSQDEQVRCFQNVAARLTDGGVFVIEAFVPEPGRFDRSVRVSKLVRWAHPPELDLMARLAGLRLRERWSSWSKEPFTKTSGKHVSVYEQAPD